MPGPDPTLEHVPWAIDESARPSDFEPIPATAAEASITDRFLAVARRYGDRPALIEEQRTITYAAAAVRVCGVAGGLVAEIPGAQGKPIALLSGHHADQVLAFLGILMAGSIVVVLDPEASPHVNRAIIADARPMAVVHDELHRGMADEIAADITRFHQSELNAPLASVSIDPRDGAMLAYTSGTSGAPKAALIPHRALLHLMRGATDALAISPTDRLPMLFPISLAVAAYPMLLPLLAGGALCLFDLRAEGLARFPAWLADQGITVIYFSPTIARFMGDSAASLEFPSLRLVVLGGERVDDQAVGIVRRQFGDHVIVANGYGSTETGVLTFYFTKPGRSHGERGVPAGWPIPGMDLRVLGPDGLPVAPGEPGDLHVRSRYLFDGYWGRPEATATVLRVDEDGLSDYRTGDIARREASGCLELIGRSDTEVKVRGHRVVPGKVEQALLALDQVEDAVVEARPDHLGAHRLVAWVVPSAASTSDAAAPVRAALAQSVPAAFLPRDIVMLDALPVLPNGKLDRQALPEPGTTRPLPSATLVPPRDDLERDLVRIWQNVLSVRPIGVDDDLFELGGSSLDAARMLIVLEEDRGVYLPMAVLIDARTPAELAAVLRQRSNTVDGPSTVVEVQPGAHDVPPLFFVHDLFGTAWVLQPLAPLLGADQPLFGFESPLLRGPASPFADLESMAARYVEDLRITQREGPYRLAGYSFGGVLAFEMARQLTATGEEVAFLGVIDVGPGYRGRHYNPKKVLDKPPMSVAGPLEPGTPWRERLRFHRELLRRDAGEGALHLLMASGLDRWTDPMLFRLDLWRKGRIHPGRRTWYAWRMHWELARSYRWEGRSYPANLTLFWAEESASSDSTMGWAKVVEGDIDIIRVDAPHETMMQTGTVERLAGPLRHALLEAR